MNFGNKPSIGDKAKAVEKRLGKTTSGKTDRKPAPKATVKVKPVGGIKNLTKGPQGVKATWKKEW